MEPFKTSMDSGLSNGASYVKSLTDIENHVDDMLKKPFSPNVQEDYFRDMFPKMRQKQSNAFNILTNIGKYNDHMNNSVYAPNPYVKDLDDPIIMQMGWFTMNLYMPFNIFFYSIAVQRYFLDHGGDSVIDDVDQYRKNLDNDVGKFVNKINEILETEPLVFFANVNDKKKLDDAYQKEKDFYDPQKWREYGSEAHLLALKITGYIDMKYRAKLLDLNK